MAASPVYQLSDYFGQTVQFPLDRALNVEKGNIIGLTVPTLGPGAVDAHRGRQLVAREPRPEGCDDTGPPDGADRASAP